MFLFVVCNSFFDLVDAGGSASALIISGAYIGV